VQWIYALHYEALKEQDEGMNLLGINPLATLRQRLGAVLGVFAGAFTCCACGLLAIFVFAPGQALEARRIATTPPMDAAALAAAAPGAIVLISGVLRGNPPLVAGLVAYTEQVWEVTVTEVEDDRSARGAWSTQPTKVVPALTLDVAGAQVPLQEVSSVRLSGDLLREAIVRGPEEAETATYEGERLPDGSRRYRGLADGDLVTVLGQKAAAGGVLPEQIFAGDRVAFEASQRDSASAILNMGICALVMAPVALIGGLFAVLFWRRR
jgi:hypothetical protein